MIKEGAVVKFKDHNTIFQGVVIALWKHDRVKVIDTDDAAWVISKEKIIEVLY